MKYTHDIVILGGGAAGLTATAGCAQLGMKTALIEVRHLGGDCLYTGCVPSKTLIHSAATAHKIREAASFGLPKQVLRTVQMPQINAHIQRVIGKIAEHDSAERFRALGAEVLFANSEFISPHELRLEGTELSKHISAPRIVIATGSSATIPPIPGLKETDIMTHTTVFHQESLPSSLAIIGGGPIGIELAQAFSRLGTKVTILEVAPQILPNEDPDIVAVLMKALAEEHIKVLTDISIQRISTEGGKKILHIKNGSQLEVQSILVAAGRKGNTDTLNLEAAGIVTKKSFIPADTSLRTENKSILAAGDVNGRYLFTHVAGSEGALAVRRLALHAGGKMQYHRVPWVIFTDPEIASVGYNEKRAQEQGIAYSVHHQSFDTVDRAYTDGRTRGMLKLLVNKKEKLIGAQIIGSGAGEILTPLLFAVTQQWNFAKLREVIYPYPIFSEVLGKAASSFLAPRLFNARIRRLLKLFFRYRG